MVTSTKPTLYKTVGGVRYLRCALNALIPIAKKYSNEWTCRIPKKELSAILCRKSRTKPVIKPLQQALTNLGYLKPLPPLDLVVIDGVWGVNTLEALKHYQKDNGLAYGQLTFESMQHLGVFEFE